MLVRGGTYPITQTIVFGIDDSGTVDSTVIYGAYPNETPVFSAGNLVEGWKPVTTPLLGLPDKAVGKVQVASVTGKFRALFDTEGLLPRARSKGFFPIKGSTRNKLHFPDGMMKNWSNIEDVEIVVRPHHAWIVNILPVKSVDEKTQMAHTTIDSTYVMNRLHFLKETKSVWVENVLEELDEPGEWVLNSEEGKLYLWPRNDSPAALSVVAPQLTELIRVEGEIDEQGPTRYAGSAFEFFED